MGRRQARPRPLGADRLIDAMTAWREAAADFDPPPPLGDGDRSRYIKLKTMDEVEQPELASWIEQAGRVQGWKE